MDLDILPDTFETRDHWWWRPGWRLGRQMHTMHLTLQNSPGAEATIRHVQDSLAGVDAVRPVPIEGLHLTMTGVGFADEVTTAQLDEVAEQVFARAEDLEVAPLVLESMLIASDAVMLCAREDPWLHQLLTIQRGAVDEVLGSREWGPFHPHVSIAYADGATGIDVLRDALADELAPLEPVVVERPTLTLMRLGRDRRVYEWDVVRELPLGR